MAIVGGSVSSGQADMMRQVQRKGAQKDQVHQKKVGPGSEQKRWPQIQYSSSSRAPLKHSFLTAQSRNVVDTRDQHQCAHRVQTLPPRWLAWQRAPTVSEPLWGSRWTLEAWTWPQLGCQPWAWTWELADVDSRRMELSQVGWLILSKSMN